MAISAYVGVPGHGKSYEVVGSVILPAYLAGRRIVTNIDGVKESNFYEYAKRHNKDLDSLGTIINCTNDDVLSPQFLPYKDAEEETFCKSGDLIAIDEAWRFWDSDKNICKEHKAFFAEHRHMSDKDTFATCDIVVINQSLDTIARFIKTRIETTYRMQKHVSVGLKNRYRVDVFTGVKLFKNSRVTSYQNKYNKEIFALYHSHYGGQGDEQTTDDRQNIFKQKKLWVLFSFIIIMLCSSGYFVYSFFKGSTPENKEVSTPQNKQTANNVTVQNNESLPKQQVIQKPGLSKRWRINGTLVKEGKSFVILTDSVGLNRLVSRAGFSNDGLMLNGIVDGEIVSYFSGEKS